ncbi:GspL/Epsl periplasmic domain-containing protein [Pseudomonas sp. RIT623]|uniref:GspL/Epsl periplasmic domain-containing protein n=1 Tax=Pseudomonas sp. RIT623 TaxID=2559075 RepID=UPI0010705F98|nr:GspL/Epsl periplasmic domain-containing protein [Pseudomonas sp. RIT623]TFF40521.1 type II secretion system protein GspL [Pseudomonas sp. RIT623]
MKLDWRRRVPARSWLLVRPGAVWDWLLVEQGVAARQGRGQPPVGLESRVALIVPAEHCSHFQLAAPPGLKREEWPLLLEERLVQASDEVACASIGRHVGQLRLWAVSNLLVAQWRGQCEAWGLALERCWAEFQLLPDPEQGEVWQWRRGETELYQGRDEQGRAHWLAWPRQLGMMPALDGLQGTRRSVTGNWPQTLARLDGLPGLFEARRVRARPRWSTAQQRLAVACLLLATTWSGLWCTQQWRQAQLYRDQVLALTAERATPGQAAQALRRLREAQQDAQVRLAQLEGLQAHVQGWLADHPAWRLRALDYDGQRWRLSLDGEGEAAPWQAMAEAVGAQVRVEDDARQVVFELGAAS